MKLHILFVQHRQNYPGELAPEALIVWDQNAVEDNPDGFEEAVRQELAGYSNALESHRVVIVHVPEEKILQALQTPEIQGTVE